MKIKTSELIEIALDWAVAKCEGLMLGKIAVDGVQHGFYSPSTKWEQGGPIIKREKMDFKWVGATDCRASIDWLDEDFFEAFGPTPLIAAMRCYVASKLGTEIDIPEELI